MRGLLASLLLACLLLESALANAELIFISNYDVELAIGDSVSQIQAQSRVRDGSTFPIDFQDYRVTVSVDDTGDGAYSASLKLLERADGSWYQVNVDKIAFTGTYSIPVDFKWRVDDIALSLAISITPAP
jgi:hypothetical protein